MMLPPSLAVLLVALMLGAAGLGAFAWAWRQGQFEHLDRQSRVIFEPRDYRLDRPWETPRQRHERHAAYGPPLEPNPGEWGGAA